MKIAAYVGSKDEADLIGPLLAHLRAIGVDHIIACDSGSVDGTAEVLANQTGPDFDYYPYDDLNTDPGHENRANAAVIARAEEVGADWLLFVDADEFPLPQGGSLRTLANLAEPEALLPDALQIDRFNVPLLATGPAMDLPPLGPAMAQALLYAPDESRPATQSRVRADADAPWIRVIPQPKLMMRLGRGVSLAEGHHGLVTPDGQTARVVVPRDIVIAHVPFTTAARFARKMANVETIWRVTGAAWGPDSAWHWRRWLDNIAARGGVAAEMARNTITPETLAILQAEGVVKSAAALWQRG